MTKAELIGLMAKEAKITKAAAEKVLNSFEGNVTKALKRGEKVKLPGLGTFMVRRRRARSGRNPQTGKEIRIPATRVAVFRPSRNILVGRVLIGQHLALPFFDCKRRFFYAISTHRKNAALPGPKRPTPPPTKPGKKNRE